MKKHKSKLITLAVTLFLLLGCVTGGSNGPYPIHAYPVVPKAVMEPDKVWQKCGDDYICIEESHLIELKTYVIKLDSLVRKYEHAIETINEHQ